MEREDRPEATEPRLHATCIAHMNPHHGGCYSSRRLPIAYRSDDADVSTMADPEHKKQCTRLLYAWLIQTRSDCRHRRGSGPDCREENLHEIHPLRSKQVTGLLNWRESRRCLWKFLAGIDANEVSYNGMIL